MKGIIFTEFLDFVEKRSGYETVDAILNKADPPSGGTYTAVGNYPYAEMESLVSALVSASAISAADLLEAFGKHLFGRFARIYPLFFRDCHDPLDFLETIELRIHTEVLKLYPDAELPSIKTARLAEDVLRINYRSPRPLGDLCIGLIRGCGEYFGAPLEMRVSPADQGLDITVRRVDANPSRVELRT